jgi:hypothetical protein
MNCGGGNWWNINLLDHGSLDQDFEVHTKTCVSSCINLKGFQQDLVSSGDRVNAGVRRISWGWILESLIISFSL